MNDEPNNDVERDNAEQLLDASQTPNEENSFEPTAEQGQEVFDESPDTLIQALNDVDSSDNTSSADEESYDASKNYCARCECEIPEYVTLCADCETKIKKYPFASKSIFLFIIIVLISCVGAVGAFANLPIAAKSLSGDIAYYQNDIEKCYNCYNDAYKLSQSLSNGFSAYTPANCVLFSSGSYTLVNQFKAMYKLNGPYDTGSYITKFFGDKVPNGLEEMKSEYDIIVACYSDIDSLFSSYYEGLGEDGEADFNRLLAIVDNLAKAKKYPSYLLDYYRYTSATYTEADVTVRCKYMDRVIDSKPDALWLYASDAISLYKESKDYGKALKICSALLKKNPSDTAALAYSMSVLRMQGDSSGAMKVYTSATKLVGKQLELERQRAIILMLGGKFDQAEKLLTASYDKSTVTLQYVNTMLICLHKTGNTAKYNELTALLNEYNIELSEDVANYVAGKTTVTKIFMQGKGDAK